MGTKLATARAIGANDRIRIGIIGAGARGQEDLKHAIAVPNVECVAMADVYTRRHDEVRRFVPKVEAYTNHHKLLERSDIDAVIVASPLHLHELHFLDVLAAGKDLYSEKTMTWSIPEAVKCRDAAKRSSQITRKQPNAPVEIGYKSAVAVLMANISYREKRRVTLEEAPAYQPKYA
ncbi:MAG: Gfo/Idh/MocA family oxidoreductase [Acidobacteriota bacterium]|nr:Gfo/Idh/MocA family oxidoreductase [Acidobacteriota bacterium]